MVRVEFKKLYEDSILPKRAHASDAGFDLYAHSFVPTYDIQNKYLWTLDPGERVLIKCGFSMSIPEGYEAQIRPRSGLALKQGISVINSPGTIDAGYRDEVGAILVHFGEHTFSINKGDRIAQMVIQKLPYVEIFEVENLSNIGDRGPEGFGSTGL